MVFFFVLSGTAFSGPLEDYLADPPVVEDPPWTEERPPEMTIPGYQAAFAAASTERDKGIAIANLAFVARDMVKAPEAREATVDLMKTWVMPNLEHTKHVERINACTWHLTLLTCTGIYQRLGDKAAERSCMAMLYREAVEADDRDVALYFFAFFQAGEGDHAEAIKTISLIPEDSPWGAQRPWLVKTWTKKLQPADELDSGKRKERKQRKY